MLCVLFRVENFIGYRVKFSHWRLNHYKHEKTYPFVMKASGFIMFITNRLT